MSTSTAPNLHTLLSPLLPAITPAAVSPQPAEAILPFLSPILRQRVKILSSSSTEPWLRLLCYDVSKVAKLTEIATSGSLEPHPVSGEVEIDWDYDAETRYRRLDKETLQGLVVLTQLGLAFQIVYCINDAEGGGDGWRIGELTVAETPSAFTQFGGSSTIAEAEEIFRKTSDTAAKTAISSSLTPNGGAPVNSHQQSVSAETMDEDEDDGYWDRYDATPANRTPADNRSPAPPGGASSSGAQPKPNGLGSSSIRHEYDADEDYYAQYGDVQPAMDNYDPDEAADAAQLEPPLGLGPSSSGDLPRSPIDEREPSPYLDAALAHPRPESSASSNGSQTVARLEATAGLQEQSEFGVKQHVSRSIRSLFMLSRASGIDRDEFARLVHTELEMLSMSDEE